MTTFSPSFPFEFPLPPIDANGNPLTVGSYVRILSVESCAQGLPAEDQQRLRALIQAQRKIIEFDRSGFVWLNMENDDQSANFCLFPAELVLA